MRYRLLGAIAAVLSLACAGARAQLADELILHGAAIYTLDAAQPWAQAVVIRAGHIVYVGDDAGALALRSARTRVVPLRGAMVLPGFHDAHTHPMSGGLRLLRCDFAHVQQLEQLQAALRACAARKPAQAWVLANGWPSRTVDARALSRALLDRWVPDRPAFVANEDGFIAWVNSKALAAAGIDPRGSTPEIAGLQRDAVTHQPSGIVEGAANALIRQRIPKPTQAEYRAALRAASALANRHGITSVFDAAANADMLEAYRAADRAGELTVRVVAAQRVDPRKGPQQVDAMVLRRERVRGKRLRADAAKIFLDEEIDLHTAAMLAPYADAPEQRGELMIQPDALAALVRRLDAEGFLIHMHAMGDRAVRAGLDAIEQAQLANGARDRRHQIAHLGVVDPLDIARFGKLGVGANFTPIWFQADDPANAGIAAALGEDRARWNYPIASIAAHRGRIAAGSDWPSTSMSVLLGAQVALTRQPLDGSKPPRQPQERLDLPAIIAAYTRDASWLAREDTIDGSIAVGKAADLVVLDRNLFDVDAARLRDVRVLFTMLEGRIVYRNVAWPWPRSPVRPARVRMGAVR